MQILRLFFPTRSRCPTCGCTHWDEAGGSRAHGLRYRRCGAGHTYKVQPIAREVALPGDVVSRILVL